MGGEGKEVKGKGWRGVLREGRGGRRSCDFKWSVRTPKLNRLRTGKHLVNKCLCQSRIKKSRYPIQVFSLPQNDETVGLP